MIKDSGERREFETGAVRDIQKGKGRCDLMPLGVVARLIKSQTVEENPVIGELESFTHTGNTQNLFNSLMYFCKENFKNVFDMMLEVSIHFEEGAAKYGENNWQKGLPTNCYIDSAVRHYLKHLRGDTDERHDRAFVWNLMCCIWTCNHKPKLNTYRKEQ